MKYFILINQQVLSETELDIIDGAILDYIYFYCNSQNEKVKKQRITDENEIWTWVDYSRLLEDMPMLKIKSIGAITSRVNKIENSGYIKTKRFQHMKKYFRMTAKSDGLFIQMNRAIHTNEQPYSSKRTIPIHINEPIKIKVNKDKKIKDLSAKADGSSLRNLEEFIIWCKKSTQRHIHIISDYADEKKMQFETKDQWQQFLKRNLRPARSLAPYSDKQIGEAMTKLNKAKKEYLTDWTLETLNKFLDK